MVVSKAYPPAVYFGAVWHLTESIDITPDNVFHLVKLYGEPEEDVMTILGEPVGDAMSESTSRVDDTTLSYRLSPVKWDEVDRKWVANQTCLVSPNTFFHEECSSDKRPSTPMRYRCPEVLFGERADFKSDLWALGCTLFEIRMGRSLFMEQERDDEDLYIKGIVDLFGELREPYWSKWKARDRFFDVDEAGHLVRTEELSVDGERKPQGMLEVLEAVPLGWADEGNRGALPLPAQEKMLFADLLWGFFAYMYLPEAHGQGMRRALQHGWFALNGGNIS